MSTRTTSARAVAAHWSRCALTVVGVLLGLLTAACAGGSGPEPPRSASAEASPSPSTSGPELSLVVFGDSWGHGAHCDGCTPWPRLLPADYGSRTGAQVTLTDLTENGGGSASLVDGLKTNPTYRAAVSDADIVVINLGSNDIGGTIDPAELTDLWTTNFDAMLESVAELRDGKPTAVRMVGLSNEYLDDIGLRTVLGESGPRIFEAFNEVSCAVAADHGGRCVDLRPVLNGADGTQPADVNSQDSMDAVSAAVVASGLPELGLS